jgi:hypothetical protein
MSLKKIVGLIALSWFVIPPVFIPGQDFSGANQSNDPCYKIKQMKKAILESADYKKTFGSKDPAYIQCYPLTINVVWEVSDRVDHLVGTDQADLLLEDEYPAYLMLHYGWFDGLQKKKLWRWEILGPEPCSSPCPGRAKAELKFFNGQVVCCLDSPYCQKKKTFFLQGGNFKTVPADAEGGYASLHFQGEAGGQSKGRVESSQLAIDPSAVQKTCGRFWGPFNYELTLGPMGSDSPTQRKMHCQGVPTADEIMEGLRVGELKKVYDFSAQYKDPIPQGFAYTLKGKATVTIAFAPVEEERWRVEVKAWERDKLKPPIKYKDKDGQIKELPVWLELDHQLTGEFVVRKVKKDWTYKEGRATQYKGWTKLFFFGTDLYKCAVVDCPGANPVDWAGAIDGEMQGRSVKLTWPPGLESTTKACVMCTPLKSFLAKLPYREQFGSGQLKYSLDKEILPLKNGTTRQGQISDWLKYTLTLTRIK